MRGKQPLFIIGFPGCGKSTFGRALAKATGREFIDLDKYIENRFMRSVSALFSERGEDGFRKIEHNMLQEVADMEGVIIAAGGGTPCFFDNMQMMLQSGTTVWLVASEETLLRRLMLAKGRRPLVAGKSEEEVKKYIRATLSQRTPFYSKAKIKFEGDQLENKKEIESTVSRFIETHIPSE